MIITIATVVFNGAATIAETIKSVVRQSYRSIEYVIVDGASTDNTLAIIQNYSDQYPYIKIKSEPDSGVYDAMNKAQQMATGDFLLFLGSDDVLYNNNVIEEFTKLVTDANRVYYGDVFAKDFRELWYGAFTTEKLILQNISHQAIFYSKKIYKHITYNLKYKLFSDWDYNLKVWSQYGSFIRIELTVTLFAQNGISGNYNQDQLFLNDRATLVKQYFGGRQAWLVEMQKMKQRLIGNTDLRKIKGYFFSKIK